MISCFTGHRKLGNIYYNPYKLQGDWLCVWQMTIAVISALWSRGCHTFIAGGAIGFDQLAAEAVLYLKDYMKVDMKLWLALPHEGINPKWPDSTVYQFKTLLARADNVIYVTNGPYAPWKMMRRNEWMVDNTTDDGTVIMLYEHEIAGGKGGTFNCMHYAMKKHKKIVVMSASMAAKTTIGWNTQTKAYCGVPPEEEI